MAALPVTSRTPLKFFVLVFALSLPFYAAGALTARALLPALPVSALGFVCPLLAAAILLYRQGGSAAVRGLLRRSFDFPRGRAAAWLLPAVLLEPAVMTLAFLLIRRAGTPIPLPQFSPVTALGLAAGFFIAGLGEELGWSGYALDPLQTRLGAFGASLATGAVWAVWHYIPLLQAGRTADFILWWTLGTLAYRVLIVWLYNNTGGSVFAAAVFHATINLTWQLFPVNGSYYDPRLAGSLAALAAAVVVLGWGPRTLAGRRA